MVRVEGDLHVPGLFSQRHVERLFFMRQFVYKNVEHVLLQFCLVFPLNTYISHLHENSWNSNLR